MKVLEIEQITFFLKKHPKFINIFLNHIKDTEFKLEICSSDEDYKELELHADLINIVNIIVNSAAYSIVIGLITNYLYDKLKDYNKRILMLTLMSI